MVALLNRHQRFHDAMRGKEQSRAEEEGRKQRRKKGHWAGRGSGRWSGGGGFSSSINFQMSAAKNSLLPPPSFFSHKQSQSARRRCHAEICAPAESIREYASRGRAPPVVPTTEPHGGTSKNTTWPRVPCQLHRHSVFRTCDARLGAAGCSSAVVTICRTVERVRLTHLGRGGVTRGVGGTKLSVCCHTLRCVCTSRKWQLLLMATMCLCHSLFLAK